MVWLYTILGVIAYVLVAGVYSWFLGRETECRDLAIGLGVVWPLTLPLCIIYYIVEGLVWCVKQIIRGLDKLF